MGTGSVGCSEQEGSAQVLTFGPGDMWVPTGQGRSPEHSSGEPPGLSTEAEGSGQLWCERTPHSSQAANLTPGVDEPFKSS